MMHTPPPLLRRFTIRTRMFGAIAIVLALLAAVGATGLAGLWRVQAMNAEFSQHSFAETRQLATLHRHLGELRRHEKDLIIHYERADAVAASKAAWAQSLRHAQAALQVLIDGEDDADNAVALDVVARLDAYRAAYEPVLRQIEAAHFDSAAAIAHVSRHALEEIEAAETLLAQLDRLLQHEAGAAAQATAATLQLARLVFAGVLALAVLLVVPLTLVNSRSIVGPIAHARKVAQAIAQGDLTQPIRVVGRDEASELLDALQQMQAALQRMVGDLRRSSDSIRTASGEIASGNADLSARTEQTASSLQQTAASMEQLTGTVRHSADAAAQANQLASSAATVARRGGTVVAQVVATMDEINASSRRIADIIGVIDGIAFQTNILALNAAVEAARAGEQGRGFAVVAGEVRSLAQRSAEAAKQIKALIGTSVDRVEAGSRLVGDAGQTMNEIVASVQRVSDIIGEISAAAAEQSQGIGQVNTAVTQLDQMTQQNAALVEQSAAAAESLKDQAQRLAGVVGMFSVGDGAPPAAASAPPPADVVAAQAIAHARFTARAPAPPRHATSVGTSAGAIPATRADDGDWQSF